MTDRASAEGLRERIESLIDDDEAAYVSVALIRAALRDTGPRPDSGIEPHPDCVAAGCCMARYAALVQKGLF